MTTKQCFKCKQFFTLENFWGDADRKDGKNDFCIGCAKNKNKTMQVKHREKRNAYAKIYWEKHREERKTYKREYDAKLRKIVLEKYGNQCACCGEKEPKFIAIDHKNNNGKQHRKEIGGSSRIVRWLIKNNFPSDFQLLCHNCNMAKAFYGVCPHRIKK